jgi:hypothetical protein
MKPLESAKLDHKGRSVRERIQHIQALGKSVGVDITWNQAKEEYRSMEKQEIWLNDVYQVNVTDLGEIVHLSIKRVDKQACRDWRDFQEIKNQLVGKECEGLELYPAESRIVDTANQFHLWVLKDPKRRVPLGFNNGRILNDDSELGVVQRPIPTIQPGEGKSAL